MRERLVIIITLKNLNKYISTIKTGMYGRMTDKSRGRGKSEKGHKSSGSLND